MIWASALALGFSRLAYVACQSIIQSGLSNFESTTSLLRPRGSSSMTRVYAVLKLLLTYAVGSSDTVVIRSAQQSHIRVTADRRLEI
ncbi:hypothetical protein F5887DRAFT_965640 [Amanita rubescens]|nr:hypothetical protein F5887DRAFT_965640 [Amanita rubescens]